MQVVANMQVDFTGFLKKKAFEGHKIPKWQAEIL